MSDRYVSSLASSGTGTSVDPWTLAQAVTAINDSTVANGETVYIKADGTYTTAGITISVAGGSTAHKALEGYTDTIGDNGKATIQRSGGAGVLLSVIQNYWTVNNLILDGQDSGTINFYGKIGNMNCNIESKNAGSVGFQTSKFINCYSHDNATDGFNASTCFNCLAVDNTNQGFDTSTAFNCIGKDNDYNFFRGSCVNCISDGGTDHGIDLNSGRFAINCIIVNSPAGKEGLYFEGTTEKTTFASNINFYDCDSNSNHEDWIDNLTELDPQFNAPASLDYTRTGDNMNRIGISEIGMVSGVDYEISLGPAGIVEDLPAASDVRSGTDYDFARLTGNMVVQPEPPRYVARRIDTRRTVAARDKRIVVVREN